ncbi:hydrolase [Kiloniella laminariae]|uniref:hydrolase n=1 Tax=Kiloniella laminariae TaxID=454162 RepID=UPI00036BB10C|nr:hydrolase [Kiloniella laminariae]
MTYKTALEWIGTQQDKMLADVLSLSNLNSGSANVAGIEQVVDQLSALAASLGATEERIALPPRSEVLDNGQILEKQSGPLLRLTKRPNANRRVLLVGHSDTVYPLDHVFQTCRHLDDNTVNGPGVADMKGGLVVMLTALQALERSPHAENIGWQIVINPDEEIGSFASAPYLDEAARAADVGMIFEPALADGTLAGARKGSGNFTLIARGKAAHAGREHHLGRNAIAALARAMALLDDLNGQHEGVTINLAKLTGGGPNNVVPDFALCRFNIRVPTPEGQSWAEQQLELIIARINAEDGISLELHGGFGRQPKVMDKAHEQLFALLRSCGADLGLPPIEAKATGGCCDGNNLAAAGLANIDTLGVRGGAIHSTEEFLLVDSLSERAKLTALLLMKLASGEASWPERATTVR